MKKVGEKNNLRGNRRQRLGGSEKCYQSKEGYESKNAA